jgi:hypothetical protein
VGIGAAVGGERADIEDRQEAETMQLGRQMKPSLSRGTC